MPGSMRAGAPAIAGQPASAGPSAASTPYSNPSVAGSVIGPVPDRGLARLEHIHRVHHARPQRNWLRGRIQVAHSTKDATLGSGTSLASRQSYRWSAGDSPEYGTLPW
jgi:hypothetical protein